MKNFSFQFMLLSLFSLMSISSAHAEKLTATEIKILPFIEAEGELDSSDGDELLIWATANKVLFGTYVNSQLVNDPKYCGKDNPRPDCKKLTFDRTKILMVFDISNKKTTFNIKNEFYDSQLELFNQHLNWDTYGCLNEEREGAVGFIALKEKDGCIKDVEIDKIKHIHKFSYVRPDGKNFDILERPFGDELRFWTWIDWLKVYLLRNFVSYSTTRKGNGESYVSSPSSVILLSPTTGKFDFIEVGENAFSGATITRAGLIASLGAYTKIPKDQQGLTLIHKNNRYKLAKEELINNTAVSPDGCHVAYLVPKRVDEMRNGYLQDIIYSKLRVIDVCKGFGVAKAANHFVTLLK
jgi:hypothetical protein